MKGGPDWGVVVAVISAIIAVIGTAYGARRSARSTDHSANLMAFREESNSLFEHMKGELARLREEVNTIRAERQSDADYIDRLEAYTDLLAAEVRRLGGTVAPPPPRTLS